MNMILYQVAISHYCEKVRWALDYKEIPYEIGNIVPGPHILLTKRLGLKQTTVPILVYGKTVVQDSTAILDYLDSVAPQKKLTPSNVELSLKALEVEEDADETIGIHLRRFFYYYLLPQTKQVKDLILQDSPAYGPYLYALIFPLIRWLMRQGMRINPESAKRSQNKLTEALKQLNDQVKGRDYLVGSSFSRADLTVASLLAPLCTPPQHPFRWPDFSTMPQELQDFRAQHEGDPFFKWVLKMYQKHRVFKAT